MKVSKPVILIIIALAVIISALFLKSKTNDSLPTEADNSQKLRLISISPNITELLFALGLGENIVGVTTFCNYPPDAMDIQKVGSIMQADNETILALRPDIVFTTASSLHLTLTERLKELNIKTLPVRVERLSDIYQASSLLANECGVSERAIALNEELKNSLTKIKQKYANDEPPKVLVVIQREPLIVAGRKTYINELLKIAGTQNAISETAAPYPQLGSEALLLCNPDIIIEITMSGGDIIEQAKLANTFYSKWQNISAVKKNRVFLINADEISRPGPRVANAAQMIASVVFEDGFENTTEAKGKIFNTAHIEEPEN